MIENKKEIPLCNEIQQRLGSTFSRTIQIGENSFVLGSRRYIYYPAGKVVFIADVHLGKSATFCTNGIPVPSESTTQTIANLTHVLLETQAEHLVVLGDLFHARSSLSESVLRKFDQFFVDHPELKLSLVLGNHDRHVGRLPSRWKIQFINPGEQISGIAVGHFPEERPDRNRLYFCGHVHPAIRLSLGHEKLPPLPCFWLRDETLVLPAFGEFTGNHIIRTKASDRIWFIAENSVQTYQD